MTQYDVARARALWLSVGALVAAAGASVALVLLPAYSSAVLPQVSSAGQFAPGQTIVGRSLTLAQANGRWIYWFLALPPALTLLSLALGRTIARVVAVPALAGGLLLFSLVGAASVGLFYLPAAVLSVVAAGFSLSQRTPPGPRRRRQTRGPHRAADTLPEHFAPPRDRAF